MAAVRKSSRALSEAFRVLREACEESEPNSRDREAIQEAMRHLFDAHLAITTRIAAQMIEDFPGGVQ